MNEPDSSDRITGLHCHKRAVERCAAELTARAAELERRAQRMRLEADELRRTCRMLEAEHASLASAALGHP